MANLPVYGLDAELKAKQNAKYDYQMEAELRAWIQAVTGVRMDGDFQEALKSGVVLCQCVPSACLPFVASLPRLSNYVS